MPANSVDLSPAIWATWPTPNYIDPVEETWLIPVVSVLLALGTIMVGARLCLRAAKHGGGLGLDDFFLITSWLVALAATVVAIYTAKHYYIGRHLWDVPFDALEGIALMCWILEFTSLLSVGLLKISVLLFYRRISLLAQSEYMKKWRWAVYVGIAFTAAYTLAFLLSLILNCKPTDAYWKAFSFTYTAPHYCADTKQGNIWAGVACAVTDLYVILLPCLMARRLDLPRAQAVALNLVFSLSLVALAASCMRTYYLWRTSVDTDLTWAIYHCTGWSLIEIQLGMVCASLPAMRVLYRMFVSPYIGQRLSSALSSRRRGADAEGGAAPEEEDCGKVEQDASGHAPPELLEEKPSFVTNYVDRESPKPITAQRVQQDLRWSRAESIGG